MTPESPLPWRVVPDGIMAADGLCIDDALIPPQDAAYVVHAANLYPELLWACRDALGTITHHPDLKAEQDRWPVRQTIDLLRAAIAKAEGHS